jgi:uncharacterized membrane protein YjjP (DUF1212 family)
MTPGMSPGPATLLPNVASLLLANGQTTEGTRISVERLARAMGQPVRFTARWGECALQTEDRTVFGEVAPTGVDIGRVVAAETVVDALCTGRIAAEEGLARLQAIARSKPVGLARFVTMAAAGAAALGVIFGAPHWLTVGVIAASAACGALLRRAVAHASDNPFLQPFAASLLAGVIGGLVARSGLVVTDRLVLVCPCMVLVPGPHFLNGGIDLVRARIPIGAGRIGLALLIVLAICGGLLSGLGLTGVAFPQAGTVVGVPLGTDVLAAGVAVTAYGSFFNMPWRLIATPVVLGMAAHAVRWELLRHGASLQLGAFGATLLVGAVIAPLAHRFRLPFGASAFAAVVALIPGVFMFDAASATLAAVNLGAKADPAALLPIVGNGVTAIVVMLAMAAGLILPKMIFDALWARP